ncbi:MAG: DUF2752 domain-containing protein [Sphingobacteriaceae bacterium]|nr:DUF2752 domain-containing protein [Sphingobacteriaceae bacterium]
MKKRLPPFELFIWITALSLLACSTPGASHFTLCPLANLGITLCPGCGLGRAITHVFHGEIKQALALHWFVFPALAVLLFRIAQLSKQFILSLKN